MRFKSYNSVLDFMYRQLPMYQRVGAQAMKKDLGNIKKLCAALGQPQKGFKSVHIAGTNGKGSTAHLIASALVENGQRVGIYTSPHYKDFRERIKIGKDFVSKKYIFDFVNAHIDIIDEIKPSFFEITVAIAFKYFKDQEVDIAIVETGLGGRLDSTNVLSPLLSVITNISLDHQAMLGNTLNAIAREKAGIIKEGIPVLIGQKQKEVEGVFKDVAKRKKSPIVFGKELSSISTKMPDPFKVLNENCANEALSMLGGIDSKFRIQPSIIKKGFQNVVGNVYYIGRYHQLSANPQIIVDSAHNVAGLHLFLQKIAHLKFKKLHVVTGFVNDKSIVQLLQEMPDHAKYYFAKANIPRGLDAEELQTIASGIGLKGKNYTSVRRALAAARSSSGENDLIIVVGSIFVIAEVL